LLQEAEKLADSGLRAPRKLAHEEEFTALAASGKVSARVVGAPNQEGVVTMGFPLPRGRVRRVNDLHLLNASGALLPLVTEPLALWPDNSIRWSLLRFQGRDGDSVTLHLDGTSGGTAAVSQPELRVSTNETGFRINNGLIGIEVGQTQIVSAVRAKDQIVCRGLEMDLCLSNLANPRLPFHLGAAETFRIESQSPLHADLRWRGRLVDRENRPGPMSYDLRMRAEAGSSRLHFWLTVLHAVARQRPWEEMKPQVSVTDWSLGLRLEGAIHEARFGVEGGIVGVTNQVPIVLLQPDDLHYQVKASDLEITNGTRAPGWVMGLQPPCSVTLGLRHFWQNHPKSLYASNDSIGVRLWAGDTPLTWEGGLAKTHEFVVELGGGTNAAPAMESLLAIPSATWLCGTEAAGALLPRNEEALRQFGFWEGWREEAIRNWANAMPTGVRDFGDAYLGGPYKGKNAYANLEYDVPMDFLHQFLRTGDRWYFDAAEPTVRHQADVDTENVAGFAWKHSPAHTTTEAEFGHVFLRGMLLHHLLTGDPRDREMAERVGDWIAGELLHGQGVGNERQIGWLLYALTALYEVTRKPLYLEAAKALCDRLAREQSPTGKFNIRWDNRIAFFNGIALSGMLSVYDLAPDPALKTAILRTANRTLGMYPEYACRTMNAWCWVLDQTRDPRFIHHLERTWVSSLEFLLARDCIAAETHGWRFPCFAVRYDLFPQFEADPGELPAATGWRPLRFKSRTVDLYLKTRGQAEGRLVVIREGLASGAAELWTTDGRLLRRVDFAQTGRLIQSACLGVPREGPWCRLRLTSPDAYAWQVQHDSRLTLTIADPKAEQLPFLLPRAVGCLLEGTREVVIRFEVMGEGFHGATLYDPRGVPVRRVERFVDFEDRGRYEMELKVPVAGPRAGWSLELNAVKVVQAAGFLPYWSASKEDWFNPE
jgi:hypothetical protein